MGRSTDDPCNPLFREIQTGFLTLRLITEVRDDGVYVKFAPLHQSFHRIPWQNIDAAIATTYDPTAYGGWGWGIRVSPMGAKKAYRISGDSGVELRRTDGRHLYLGSQRPTELVNTIDRARADSFPE